MHIEVLPFHKEDIRSIRRLHKAAFKGYMNASLGNRYVEAFLNWFLHYPGTVTLKAIADGKVCGYVVGAPIGYDKDMNRKLFNTVVVGVLTHPLVLLHNGFLRVAVAKFKMLLGKKPVKKVIKNPDGKGISLVGIAVDPAFAGHGIGKAIMDKFENDAVGMNLNYMRLSVYKDNMRARAVYEKSGWQVLDESDKIVYYYKEIS